MLHKLLCLALLLAADLTTMAPFILVMIVAGRATVMHQMFVESDGVDWRYWNDVVGISLIWVVVMAREGLYVRRHRFPAELRHLARSLVLSLLILLAASALRLIDLPSIHLLLTVAPAMTSALALERRLVKPILFELGLWRKEVLLVGAGPTGRRLIDALAGDRFTGLSVVAALDDDPALIGTAPGGVPVVGPLDDLETHLRPSDHSPHRDLLIAIPSLPRARLQSLMARVEGRVESIRFVPDLLGLSTLGVELESLKGTPAIRLKQNLMKPWNAAIKRTLDIVFGLVLSILMLPVGVVLCVLIRLETPGPPVLVQARLGRRGQLFRCWKFRTMYLDGETRLAAALAANPTLQLEWETYAKLRGRDPRVTPVGRWLRRLSLDELPQLLHVLSGDMSLIGPRPYLPRESERIGASRSVIGAARPGLTGLWQVSGRNELTFQERLELDEFYIRNWSVWMDFAILVRTVGALVTGRGAY